MADTQQVGRVLHETYRIEGLIGEGGMGTVYEASHTRLARRFAVKLLTPNLAKDQEALERFKREALITSALGHPHILEVIDFNYLDDGLPYLVMELLQGQDLGDLLKTNKRLSIEQAAGIFRQTASALHAAHEHGVVHRDLKPQNIFLARKEGAVDFVKIVDFGISKVLGSASALTGTHAMLGTPLYMAPEQAEGGASEADRRVDVYAAASILYEMLVGEPPFFASSIPSLLYMIVHTTAPTIHEQRPEVPPAVDAVVRKAMSKDREDRFADLESFSAALDRALAGESVSSLGVEATVAEDGDGAPSGHTLVGQRVGNYVVKDLLGEGGMGAVYLAEHPEIGRTVAIKVLADHLLQNRMAADRFVSEAKAVTRTRHPNIIDIYDFGRLADGRLYYIMEHLEGRELRALMKERGKFSAAEALPYVQQICNALQAAHEHGVVHRDLKPENVFVEREAPVKLKLLDFGIAKLLENASGGGGSSLTTTGMVMGTPLVIAPEQAAGQPDRISARTDIYSLGVIVYWMLAGRPPFMDQTAALLLAQHIKEPVPPLTQIEPSVPPTVAQVIHRCLEKQPEDRFGSTVELAAAYTEALTGVETALTTVPGTGPQPLSSTSLPTAHTQVPAAVQVTTLQGAAGEISTTGPQAPAPASARPWIPWAAIGGGVLVLGAVSLVLALTLGGGPETTEAVVASAGATEPIAPKTPAEPKTPAAPKTPAKPPPTPAEPAKPAVPTKQAEAPAKQPEAPTKPVAFTVSVKTRRAGARCSARIDGADQPAARLPCSYKVTSGQKLTLKVTHRGETLLRRRITVTRDLELDLPPEAIVRQTSKRSSATRTKTKRATKKDSKKDSKKRFGDKTMKPTW
jgi:serine/threonine protein kinase